MCDELNSPERIAAIRATVQSKPALRRLYEEIYSSYRSCLARCPATGIALELGSGASFAQKLWPLPRPMAISARVTS